jgi:hypothetical protein
MARMEVMPMNMTELFTALLKLTLVAAWLLCKATYQAARLAAQLTAAALPPASSAATATLRALLAGGAWVAIGALLAVPVGEPAAVLAGAGGGAVIGGMVAVALFERGRAEAAAGRGAVALGTRPGSLGVARPHIVARASRVRHLAVFGATGSGKSTVLKNLALQDAAAPGRPGLLVVDVKDDLVADIAAALPPQRLDDVLLFDLADTAYPPAFNPLAGVPAAGRTLAAAELLSALKRLYAETWGPRLEHVLRMTLLTLLETPEATLLDITRLLTDPAYRAWAVAQVGNTAVRHFWEREFAAITGSRGSLANVESILNKLSVFAYPEVSNVLGQSRRGLDLRRAMDEGRIVLAHLPQGVLGEDAAMFLGALLVGKVQLAAQSRVTLPAPQRRPFYLFVDEFQNYATSAFDKLITEGRSMAVGVVAACQFREQLDPGLRLALEKNCAHALHCRLVDGRHRVVVQKLQEPEAVDALTLVRPLPPPHGRGADQLAAIRARSRSALARPRAEVEAELVLRLARGRVEPGDAVSMAPPAEPVGAASRRKEVADVRFYE